ncbi:phosphate ABC transporter substrate-binding protein PstS [Solicola sp. PLA-1-18]|uniref:phosphate ABC transporter substrate-binding protein PstS n=1 Tax=Solicola sp. PLA-1-18 TaxID=3380532 RepID=UPI003B77F114
MNRTIKRVVAPAGAALMLAAALSACGAGNESDSGSDGASSGDSSLSGTLSGAGASSQEAAVSAWQQGFQSANPDVTVNYDPVGSGGGREQFIAGGIDFAGSDAYLEDEELTGAKERCGGNIVEVPTYVSPIAVVYNLQGVDELNLSPAVVGDIFQGTIKTWDDAKIKADNPDADLPSTAITPVHRSDDSGTTENFTDYLDQTSGGTWTGGAIQTWPIKGGEGAEGTSGVISAVQGGDGTIGYADASQAGDLGVAKIGVGDEFVEPTADAAAAVLDESEQVSGRDATDIAFTVNRTTTESGVYPIVLVSYMIACEKYEDAAKGELVKGFLTYVSSADGQEAAAKGAGSAPISEDLESKIRPIVEKIS